MYNNRLVNFMKIQTINFYQRIYYCFHKWNLLLDHDASKFPGVATTSAFFFIYYITIIGILSKTMRPSILANLNDANVLVPFGVFVIAIHYWLLASFGRLERIRSIIEEEDEVQKNKWKYITIFYATFSLVAFFASSIIKF